MPSAATNPLNSILQPTFAKASAFAKATEDESEDKPGEEGKSHTGESRYPGGEGKSHTGESRHPGGEE